MSRSFCARWFVLILVILLLSAGLVVFAQEQEGYQPHVGQAGKDVVWVPTDEGLVEKMLDLAKVTSKDFVIDLGSGDGRTVIAAAKRGAHAEGIEYNPDMVDLSIRNAAEAGVSDRTAFAKADLFESDFSKASVITMFLLPDINLKLRPTLLNLKPGTRIVSNSFTMEDWRPDGTASTAGNCYTWCTAYLWIVPAKVEGTWRIPDGELTLTQQFQIVNGKLQEGGKGVAVEGRLDGNQLRFQAGDAEFEAQVNGDEIVGTVKSVSGENRWSATRLK
jgi:SAM-dependent methyltransferase